MTPEQRQTIVTTLRGQIQVQDDHGQPILMGGPAFWNRCQAAPTDDVIYVDGYVQACKWNSWRVMEEALEPELRLFQGYALSPFDGRWLEHCWCMLGNRIIETTGEMVLYFGAELNAAEREAFNAAAAQYHPEEHHQGRFWISCYTRRYMVNVGPEQIGRERQIWSGELKEGLGHPDSPEPAQPVDGA